MAKTKVTQQTKVTTVPLEGVVILIGNGTCHLKKGVEYMVTAEQAKVLLKKNAGEIKQ